jgi:carboxypeptidase A2
VDGNRNFDFFWNTVGTSNDPCRDNFAGNVPFSEIETRIVRDIVNQNIARMGMYITMHSYGSMILYPWGHNGTLSDNAFALHLVGIAMADAIFELSLPSFPRYSVGNSVQVIGYPASGSSEDWVHQAGVPLTYTYELPGVFPGFDGFILPPQYIEQVCVETWAGFVAGARRAADLIVIRP